MKTMRLLLLSSIFIAIAAIGWSAYYYYTAKQRMADYASALIEKSERFPVETRNPLVGGDSQAITDAFLETSDEDSGVLFSIQTPSADDAVPAESAEAEEFCCPEDPDAAASPLLEEAEEVDSPPNSSAKVRARLVKVHGDIPEVDTFMSLSAKLTRRETMTRDEALEHFRLMAFFLPSEQNIKAYEYMKQLHAVADPDYYEIEHHD